MGTGSAGHWSVRERLSHLGPQEEPESQGSQTTGSLELWKVLEQGNSVTGAPGPQKLNWEGSSWLPAQSNAK